MVSTEIARELSANSSTLIDAKPRKRKVPSIAARFFPSNISINDHLPRLIGTLVSGIIMVSTCARYRGLKKSSNEPRRHLQELTQKPATISQESPPLSLIKL
jgi:hypothetical protein